jgi:hypothetical protein
MKYIELTQGQRAIVDDDDYEELSRWKWHALKRGGTFYGARKSSTNMAQYKPRYTVYIHAFIMDTPQGMYTDHINGNGLDNRKSNLRICTSMQNQYNTGPNSRNTSGYKGVYWSKSNNKWQARIKINKKKVYLGNFKTLEDAYTAYCNKAQEAHGEFARLQ